MNNEINEFLNTGLNKYNEAHNIYWRFREEIQKVLNTILKNRENFGRFNADENSLLTRPWVNGLILNSRVDGYIYDIKYSIGIGLDWTNNESNLPVPFVWIEDEKRRYVNLDKTYNWSNIIYDKNHYLGFFNSYKIENLEEIYDELLNEFVEYLDENIIE